MRRRRRSWAVPEPPAELRSYDPALWESADQWAAARHEWAETNGWIGGALQLFLEHCAVRSGKPMPPPSYPYWRPVGRGTNRGRV